MNGQTAFHRVVERADHWARRADLPPVDRRRATAALSIANLLHERALPLGCSGVLTQLVCGLCARTGEAECCFGDGGGGRGCRGLDGPQ